MQPESGQNPNYDFILQNSPSQKRSLLPKGRPIILVGALLFIVMIVIILFGLFFGGKGAKGSKALIVPLGKSTEISRINTAEAGLLGDPATATLASTVGVTMISDQSQIKLLLAKSKIKIDKKELADYEDKSIDKTLSAAAQANNLDSAYKTYLRRALSDYAASLKTAYGSTKDIRAKQFINSAYSSASTLLQSPQLKN